MIRESDEFTRRRSEAAEEFDRHERRHDGTQAAAALGGGLTVLRELLYTRLQQDLQNRIGMDSTLTPLSEEKCARVAKAEIELYQIAASTGVARHHGYTATDDDWYLRWLSELRFGKPDLDAKATQRLGFYLAKTPDQQRLAFTNILTKALPQSRRAPLVIFRLMPLAVEIITALAFGDQERAADARDQQVDQLPAIHDCQVCHGKLLANGEQCRGCGNPLWKLDWLMAID